MFYIEVTCLGKGVLSFKPSQNENVYIKMDS